MQATNPSEAAVASERSEKRFDVRRLIVVLAGLILIAAYVGPLWLFFHETRERHREVDPAAEVELGLRVSIADFARGTVTFHIMPTGGKLLGPNGRLTQEVVVETDPGTGTVSHTFHPGLPITPWIVTASTDSGDILAYPFDTYAIELELLARSADRQITLSTAIDDTPHGLKASSTERFTTAGDVEVEVEIARSGTIIFVALLQTVSLVLVSVAACAVAWYVALRRRKIEFSMMIWTAALLFLIPTVRNALPGGVPTGAMIDYFVFFWLQISIAVAMCLLVVTWLRRATA